MRYDDYETRLQSINRRYVELSKTSGLAALDRERHELHQTVDRTYDIGNEKVVITTCSIAVFAKVRETSSLDGLWLLTGDQVHVLAEIVQTWHDWRAGKLDDLPPSGPWTAHARDPVGG